MIAGASTQGTLRGFDQTINVILDECHERVFSLTQGVSRHVLGLYIVRGDNMHVILPPLHIAVLLTCISAR